MEGSMALIRGLADICIHTDDMRKSLDFYKNILGFELFYSYVSKKKPEDGTLYNFVRAGSCVVMLTQPKDLNKIKKLGNSNGNHFALDVLGLDELIGKIKKAGYSFEQEVPRGADDFFPTGYRSIFLQGPSGERIALVEYGYKNEPDYAQLSLLSK